MNIVKTSIANAVAGNYPASLLYRIAPIMH